MKRTTVWMLGAVASAVTLIAACSSDDSGTEAQKRGVGAACTKDTECTEAGQKCLAFKGGYCGAADCTSDAQCPAGSACVKHDDARNYCFLVCLEKVDCNVNRPVDTTANCSSSVTFVDGKSTGKKACVPPS